MTAELKEKVFKTKLAGRQRRNAMTRGRIAARKGYKRICPIPNTREGMAWLEGFDEETKIPATLKHCTDCGRIFSDNIEACPTCESINVRPNVGIGTEIVMTVGG